MSGFLPGLRKKQYGYILKSGISSDIFRSRVTRGIALIRKKIMKTSYDRNIAVRDHRFDEFYEKFIKLSGGVCFLVILLSTDIIQNTFKLAD